MKIPQTWRKKALFIVDVQEWFLIERNKYILWNIKKLITLGWYDCIIYSISYNKEGSIWYSQVWWCENPIETETISEIVRAFVGNNVYKVFKLTRSVFKADSDVLQILQKHHIEEIHISGIESNDCVFATALEASDYQYVSFVIEEASETRTYAPNHQKALDILRYLKLTNNSEFVWYRETKFLEL